MSARHPAVLTAATALSALSLVGAATAASAASDSPTPYRVTGTGLDLPEGATLGVHGHVNVVYSSALGTGARNVHIEGPGTRYGDLVGASGITWDRVGLPPDACVTWVQVGGYDEHFGEGGQAPVCRTDTPAAPPAAPAPSDAVPVAPPAEGPQDGEGGEPGPAAPPAAEVAVPVPVPPAEPLPPTSSTAAPPPVAEVAAPVPAAAPAPAERAEVLAAVEPSPASSPTPAAASTATERSEVLAATGVRTGALLGGAALALVAGAALVLWRRRSTGRP